MGASTAMTSPYRSTYLRVPKEKLSEYASEMLGNKKDKGNKVAMLWLGLWSIVG